MYIIIMNEKSDKLDKIQLTDEQIKKLFYDPKIGLTSTDKFFKKLHDIDPTITKKRVKEIIEKQEIHQVFKRIVKPKKFNSVVANYPMDCVQCDFIVYDRYKQNHYSYILTIIDVYSRAAYAKATTNMENKTIIKELKHAFENVFKSYPRIFSSDQQFARDSIVDFLESNGVECHFSSPYEINKQAIIERFNGTLAKLLNKIRKVTKNHKWYEYLDDCVLNYNTSYHKTIKK